MADKVIVFDLGKVIFDYDVKKMPPLWSAYSSNKSLFQDMESFMIKNINLFAKYEKGLISSVDFYKEISSLLEMKNLSFDNFCEIWNDIFTPMDDVIELVKSLSKKYELALLSNTNELHFDYLYKDYSGFFKNFKKLHLSYLMNLRKPNIEIYNEVLKYHDIKPENMFFTDDNQENIDAAKKTGIRAYTFKNVMKLKQDLADFGIEV